MRPDESSAEMALARKELTAEVTDPQLVDGAGGCSGLLKGAVHSLVDVVLEVWVVANPKVRVLLPDEIGVLRPNELGDVPAQHIRLPERRER